MKRLATGFLAAVAVSVGGCSYTRSLLPEMEPLDAGGQTAGLTWEVENRHRLLAGQDEQDRFEQDLAAYIEEYRHWHKAEESSGPVANFRETDLLHQRDEQTPPNYAVNYDPGANSYRCRDRAAPICRGDGSDWIADRSRTVRLRFGEGQCRWTIGRVEDTADCSRSVPVVVGEETAVRALRLSDGAVAETTLLVRDIVIVALGDSFSAGEGNPHRQWRVGGEPAAWLDARCHRSLMSGPALTAAFLARSNPHASVTLLHYGCSGASIADGLVTPWSQLETTADIRRQYAAFGIRGAAFENLRVATARPQLHDVPLSQLRQAQSDLTVDGRLIQPDVIIVSIGGNDIGFASIVSALADEGSTSVDLRVDPGAGGLEQVNDWRPYASFDQTSWVQSARNVPCFGLERVECMGDRILDRISGPSSTQNRTTLRSQYDELAEAIRPLSGVGARRVFITHYPNFVMREPDGVPAGQARPEQAVACHDEPWDGRPGFVPGVLASLPGLGMDRTASGQAQEKFLDPLNQAISAAAEDHGWAVVATHVRNAKTNGYCSDHRYYNTLLDSYWDQGRRYDTGRPLGNLVILRPDNLFNLPVGTRVIWDASRGCFVRYPEQQSCLPAPQSMPVLELRREIEEGSTFAEMVAEPSIWGTTGPVHPNLFGHCNYASAILTSLVRDRPEMTYGAQLVDDVRRAGPDGLKAGYVCDARQWGFTHAAPHPGWD